MNAILTIDSNNILGYSYVNIKDIQNQGLKIVDVPISNPNVILKDKPELSKKTLTAAELKELSKNLNSKIQLIDKAGFDKKFFKIVTNSALNKDYTVGDKNIKGSITANIEILNSIRIDVENSNENKNFDNRPEVLDKNGKRITNKNYNSILFEKFAYYYTYHNDGCSDDSNDNCLKLFENQLKEYSAVDNNYWFIGGNSTLTKEALKLCDHVIITKLNTSVPFDKSKDPDYFIYSDNIKTYQTDPAISVQEIKIEDSFLNEYFDKSRVLLTKPDFTITLYSKKNYKDKIFEDTCWVFANNNATDGCDDYSYVLKHPRLFAIACRNGKIDIDSDIGWIALTPFPNRDKTWRIDNYVFPHMMRDKSNSKILKRVIAKAENENLTFAHCKDATNNNYTITHYSK